MKDFLLEFKDKFQNLGTNINYWDIKDLELRFYLSMIGIIKLDDKEKQKDYKALYFAMDLLVPMKSFINACWKLNINLNENWFDRYTILRLADAFAVNFPLMLARVYDYYNKIYSAGLTELLNFNLTFEDLTLRLNKILYSYNKNYEYTMRWVKK